MKVVTAILACFVVEAVVAGPRPSKEFICLDKPDEGDIAYFGEICDVVALNDYAFDPTEGVFTKLIRNNHDYMKIKPYDDPLHYYSLDGEHFGENANEIVSQMRASNAQLKKFAELFIVNTDVLVETLDTDALEGFLLSLQENDIQGVIITPYSPISAAHAVQLLPELTAAFQKKHLQVYFAAPAVTRKDLIDYVTDKMELCDKIIMKTTNLAEKNSEHFDAPLSGDCEYTIEKTLAAYLAKGFPKEKLVGALSFDGAHQYRNRKFFHDSYTTYCTNFNNASYGWSLDETAQCYHTQTTDVWATVEIPQTLDTKSKYLLSKATGGIAVYGTYSYFKGCEQRCTFNCRALASPIVKNFRK